MKNPFYTKKAKIQAVLSYEKLRKSGEVNMFMARPSLGFTKEQMLYVMGLYDSGEAQKIISKVEDRPEPGKQYRLTGGSGEKAISKGNTWAESEVKCPVCDKPFKDSRTCPECDKLVDSL